MASSVKLADVVPSRFAHLTPTDQANVERIRLDLVEGSKILLNNPHVFKNEAGKWELLAGHDRAEAARRAGWTEIPVRDFTGTLNSDDAILAHFCRENLLRKEISKAAIAGEWLRRHPEWTDVRIAAASGSDNGYVGEVRAKLVADGVIGVTQVRATADGKERKYKPRAPRLSGSRRAQPKDETPEDRAAAIVAAAEARRVSAERRAPEADEASRDADPSTKVERGENPSGSETIPTGATASERETSAATGEVPTECAGGVQSSLTSNTSDDGLQAPAKPGTPESVDPVVPPASTSAVRVDGRTRFSRIQVVLAALPSELPGAPTIEDLSPLTDEDEARLTALGRWAQQMVAARRRTLKSEAA